MKKCLQVNKKLKDLGYVERRYEELNNQMGWWNNYYSFKCNDYFKGKVQAKINRKYYFKNSNPIRHKMGILEKIIERLESEGKI